MTRLHVIDGTFELFRAHYSKRPTRIAPDGTDVKGTLGVVGSLLALLDDREEAVTHLAVAFDNPIESFRNEMYDGYKTSEGLEPIILAQLNLVEDAVAALGITVWSMDRFEADDALATAAHKFRGEVDQVRLMTPDKDLGQSVIGNEVVQVDRMRSRVIDEQGVIERNGVLPKYIPDWLALVGDTADGIPGVPGLGAKTATKLIEAFGPVESIPTNPESWPSVRGAAKLSETLANMQSEVALFKKLATLATDAPLVGTLSHLEWRGAPKAAFEAMAKRLGGITMQPRKWQG